MSSVLIKKEQQPECNYLAQSADRSFGLAVYSAFLQLARAFFRRYVGGEPKCKNCGRAI